MLLAAAQVLVLVAFPAAAIALADRVKVFKWVGPVVTCYAFGILLANLPFVPVNAKISMSVTEAAVPLALPMLLFSTNLASWARLARPTLVAFGLAVLSAMAVAYFAGRSFAGDTDESWKVAGMLVGVYVGGTANMSAIGLALGVRNETFVLLNAADVICGGVYFLFLLVLAQRVYLLVMPAFKFSGTAGDGAPAEPDPTTFLSVWKHAGLRKLLPALGLSVGIVALSIGLSLALFREVHVTTVLLTLTTASLALSFVPAVRALEGAYEMGEYLMLVFCVSVGSLADLRQVLSSSPMLFVYTAAVMFGAIAVHFALCAVFRIDADTAIITSTATIYGPAFIAPVASALKNREIIVSGITSAVVGFAFGTYAGLGVAYLLRP